MRVVPSRSLGTEESTWGGHSLGSPSCGHHTCHMALSAQPPRHPGSVTPPPPDPSADPSAQVHNPCPSFVGSLSGFGIRVTVAS